MIRACRPSGLNQALRPSILRNCQALLLGQCRQPPVLAPQATAAQLGGCQQVVRRGSRWGAWTRAQLPSCWSSFDDGLDAHLAKGLPWLGSDHSPGCHLFLLVRRARARKAAGPWGPAGAASILAGRRAGLASSWVKIADVPLLIASMRCPASLLALAAALGACLGAAPSALAAPDPSGQGGTKAMFATKAEAEAAAKQFHCQGAHKMGTLWMPCASHADTTGSHSGPKAH